MSHFPQQTASLLEGCYLKDTKLPFAKVAPDSDLWVLLSNLPTIYP